MFRYTVYQYPILNPNWEWCIIWFNSLLSSFQASPPKKDQQSTANIWRFSKTLSTFYLPYMIFWWSYLQSSQILSACRFCCPDFHWLSTQQIKGCGTCRYADDDARFEQTQVERMKRNTCGTSCGYQTRVIARTDWELWRREAGKPKPVKAYQVGKGRNWTCTYLGN